MDECVSVWVPECLSVWGSRERLKVPIIIHTDNPRTIQIQSPENIEIGLNCRMCCQPKIELIVVIQNELAAHFYCCCCSCWLCRFSVAVRLWFRPCLHSYSHLYSHSHSYSYSYSSKTGRLGFKARDSRRFTGITCAAQSRRCVAGLIGSSSWEAARIVPGWAITHSGDTRAPNSIPISGHRRILEAASFKGFAADIRFVNVGHKIQTSKEKQSERGFQKMVGGGGVVKKMWGKNWEQLVRDLKKLCQRTGITGQKSRDYFIIKQRSFCFLRPWNVSKNCKPFRNCTFLYN